MKLKIFRILSASLLIILMCVIFMFSAQNSTESSAVSGGIIERIASVVNKNFETLNLEEQQELISSYQFIARKTAHFTVYGALGILSFLTIISYYNIKFNLRPVISAGICLIYAACDEFHQFFVPGRACQLRDVVLDFSGSLLAIIICTVIVRKIKSLYKLVGGVKVGE